ncbi:hypothetical protein AOLI_G00085830 [Acnodon oligacanthus]
MAEAARALGMFVLVLGLGDIFCAVVVPVETGQNYTFKSSVSGTPEAILWKFKKNKVVEYENNDQTWYRFETRAHLDIITGDFTLKQLRKEDSGQYESEIQVNGKLQYSNHEINVMDAVPVPIVTCHTNSTQVTLLCSVGSSVQATFEWSGPNGFKKTGDKIIVSKEQAIYICTAQNDLGKKSTQLSLANCNTDGHDGPLPAIVSVVCVALLSIFGVIGFVLYRKKKRNSGGINPEDGNLHFDKNNPNNAEETCTLLDKQPNTSETSERSNQAPNSQEHLNASKGDESKKSTDNHLERHESHADELPSLQNEDKKSQETIPKTESEENNEPSEEEEQIPVNKDLAEGKQENTLKTDTEPQIQDAKEQPEVQSVAKEDKEKKHDVDETVDERANTINYSEERQDSAGQNPEESLLAAANGPENPHTENNGNPSSSMTDKDQSVKQESDQAAGRVEKTVKEIESRLWKPREIFSKKTNQENGNI